MKRNASHKKQKKLKKWKNQKFEKIKERIEKKQRPPRGTPETAQKMFSQKKKLQEIVQKEKPKPWPLRVALRPPSVLLVYHLPSLLLEMFLGRAG